MEPYRAGWLIFSRQISFTRHHFQNTVQHTGRFVTVQIKKTLSQFMIAIGYTGMKLQLWLGIDVYGDWYVAVAGSDVYGDGRVAMVGN